VDINKHWSELFNPVKPKCKFPWQSCCSCCSLYVIPHACSHSWSGFTLSLILQELSPEDGSNGTDNNLSHSYMMMMSNGILYPSQYQLHWFQHMMRQPSTDINIWYTSAGIISWVQFWPLFSTPVSGLFNSSGWNRNMLESLRWVRPWIKSHSPLAIQIYVATIPIQNIMKL